MWFSGCFSDFVLRFQKYYTQTNFIYFVYPSGDLSVWPSGGDGVGGRSHGGERQYDLRGLQASVRSDQWEHWRCLPATSCRRQQGEAHVHACIHLVSKCSRPWPQVTYQLIIRLHESSHLQPPPEEKGCLFFLFARVTKGNKLEFHSVLPGWLLSG